ncbi:chemotaxis protein, partial [Cellulomonas carbonis T26]
MTTLADRPRTTPARPAPRPAAQRPAAQRPAPQRRPAPAPAARRSPLANLPFVVKAGMVATWPVVALVVITVLSANPPKADANGEIPSAAPMLAGVTIVAVVATVLSAMWLARATGRAFAGLQHVAEGLATGDLTRRTGIDQRDEVGRVAAVLDAAVADLAGTLDHVVGSSQHVAENVERLTSGSARAGGDAAEASAQAGVVAAAAEQVSRNVQAVAAGAEQMGASIREIAQNATQAVKVAEQATAVAASTNETVSKLGTSSQEIGNV